MKLKIGTILTIIIALSIGLIFIFLVFKVFPIGVAIAIVGGILATHGLNRQDKALYRLGLISGWLYPLGIIISFIYSGWISGIAAIIFGFFAYRYAKER